MQVLATISDDESITHSGQAPEGFRHRRAARAVVLDGDGRVALLHVTKHGYHKLPGGGIDDGEDIVQALEREIKEEVGCEVTVVQELGQVNEYIHAEPLFQESFCYVAKVTGEKGQPHFTQKELDAGFRIVWADSIQHAIDILENDMPQAYPGISIRKRDLAILRQGQAYLAQL